MGKKSKKNNGGAKAKDDTVSSRTGGFVGAASGGTGGSIGAGSKKLKCMHCLCKIKEGKGTSCPGCSLIFCWRCEKKYFEGCPNGDECVHKVRRCFKCAGANNALTLLKEMNQLDGLPADGERTIITKENVAMLEKRIQADDTLSLDFMPLEICSGANNCMVQECYRCTIATHVGTRLLSCVECRKTRCDSCRESGASREAAIAAAQSVVHGRRSMDFVEDDVLSMIQILRGDGSSIAVCRRCHVPCCFQCLDDRFARNVAKSLFSCFRFGKDAHYLCSSCYWSSKPCTNRTCPNDTGVPTQRCGGCHLERYCSVACQAAAYPGHMIRCQKIQAKRAEARKSEGK